MDYLCHVSFAWYRQNSRRAAALPKNLMQAERSLGCVRQIQVGIVEVTLEADM